MDELPRLDAFGFLRAIAEGAPLPTERVEANARLRFTVAQALAEGRVGFHFQPVVSARDPGFVAFHEMLARLTLADGRVLPPAAFLPNVEDGPLGRALDRLAIRSACEALAADPSLRLSVNMSPLSIGDAGWFDEIARAADADRGVTGRLILEITETAGIERSTETLAFMERVRGFGCAFALDDFGAGATGFRHFRDFRFDMVKIDGAFAQGASRSPDARVLVECLVRLARHFEMMVVAERVECDADADCLRGLGVDSFQGYRFGRPSATPQRPGSQDPLRRAG